ncbi:MAG: immunoglobulin-like domain-containing protein [Bacteroidota bacterium]
MKTQSLILIAGTVSCILISCSKAKDQVAPSDTTPPVITLLGKNPDTLIVKTVTSYNDPGATASDDKDGDITNKIVVAPQGYDFTKTGSFIIYYNVEDNAHNLAEKLKRTVMVVAAAATYDATSTCIGSSGNSVTVTSYSNNDSIIINDFYASGSVIKAGLNNYKYKIIPVLINGLITVNGDLTAKGTTLNGNITFTGATSGNCTSTFVRH